MVLDSVFKTSKFLTFLPILSLKKAKIVVCYLHFGIVFAYSVRGSENHKGVHLKHIALTNRIVSFKYSSKNSKLVGVLKMHTFGMFIIIILVVLETMSMTGCAKKSPGCNSKEIRDLIIEISKERFLQRARAIPGWISAEQVKSLKVDVVNIKTSNFNEDAGCYECAANLSVTGPQGTKDLPITFKSELTDGGKNFYVTVSALQILNLSELGKLNGTQGTRLYPQ